MNTTVPANFFGIRNSFQTIYDTTLVLNTYSVKMDSVITSRLSAYALGIINDPLLGKSKASVAMQYGLPSNQFTWGGATKLDSVVLQLRFRTQPKSDGTYLEDFYGDKNAIHTLKVYKLNESISWDSNYYSTRKYAFDGIEVGSWTGKYNFTDSTKYKLGQKSVVIPPHIRITLKDDYKNLLFAAEANNQFLNTTAFKATFKGFVVIDESNVNSGEGAIVYVKLNSNVTALTAFYSDSLSVNFPVTPGSEAAYNYYEQSDIPAGLLQNSFTGVHRDTCFAQPFGGSKVRVELPNLYALLNNPRLAINGAEIIFSVLEGSDAVPYISPPQLSLVGSDSLGRNVFLKDQVFELGSYYDGLLNSNYNEYHFNIVRHLQYLLDSYKKGYNYNYGMNLIVTADYPVSAQRVALNTRKNTGKLKLKLTYTVIK